MTDDPPVWCGLIETVEALRGSGCLPSGRAVIACNPDRSGTVWEAMLMILWHAPDRAFPFSVYLNDQLASATVHVIDEAAFMEIMKR